ncbi:SPOSA6832_01085, partial [Sporobolomyces salmonicolor]
MPPRRVVSRSNAPGPSTSSSPGASSTTSTSAPVAAARRATEALNAGGFAGSVEALWKGYNQQTPSRLKLIDGFMLFLMLTGVAQFLYCLLITNYPFNAFLGGFAPISPSLLSRSVRLTQVERDNSFAATVGQFVLAGALRIQVNPVNKDTFPTVSPERAFGDFIFASVLLHFFSINYLG